LARTAYDELRPKLHDSRRQYRAIEDTGTIDCIVSGYTAGHRIKEIMAECGVSSISLVYDVLRSAGVPLRRNKRDAANPDPLSVARAIVDPASFGGKVKIMKTLGRHVYEYVKNLDPTSLPPAETLLLAGELMARSASQPGWARSVLANLTPVEVAELQEAVLLIHGALPRRIRARLLTRGRGPLAGRGPKPWLRVARQPWARTLARALLSGVHISPVFVAYATGAHIRTATEFVDRVLYPNATFIAGAGHRDRASH